MTLYTVVTKDKYELPLFVADNLSELSAYTGISKDNLSVMIWRYENKNSTDRYRRIIVE